MFVTCLMAGWKSWKSQIFLLKVTQIDMLTCPNRQKKDRQNIAYPPDQNIIAWALHCTFSSHLNSEIGHFPSTIAFPDRKKMKPFFLRSLFQSILESNPGSFLLQTGPDMSDVCVVVVSKMAEQVGCLMWNKIFTYFHAFFPWPTSLQRSLVCLRRILTVSALLWSLSAPRPSRLVWAWSFLPSLRESASQQRESHLQ